MLSVVLSALVALALYFPASTRHEFGIPLITGLLVTGLIYGFSLGFCIFTVVSAGKDIRYREPVFIGDLFSFFVAYFLPAVVVSSAHWLFTDLEKTLVNLLIPWSILCMMSAGLALLSYMVASAISDARNT